MSPERALSIVIEDDDETVRVDPLTGTVETDQPDGGVVVQLDARKERDEDDDNGWFANLADEIDEATLGIIANDLIEAIQADDNSRGEYLAIKARGLSLLGTKLEEPRSSVDSTSGVDGMSSVTNPLLLEAVLKGWANSQAELLPANGPVKIRDDGDESVAEDELAESFERDMNHWFTTTAAEYYPDTSHMLLWGVYFGGSGFKKVYRCPMRRRPVSESVDAKDMIVSDTTKDLRSCARITHQIPMRPSVMKRMKFIGAYRDIELTQPTPQTNPVDAKIAGIQGTRPTQNRPEDQPYTIYEIQCELDLDQFIPAGSKLKGEGIPLPYLVSIDKDSRAVLAIRRDWDEDNEECERKRMYVKYPYVPGPGFYGTGMLNILGNASAAMTAAWREALDAGMFASFPGGLIAKNATRQNTSNFRSAPGEFAPVDTGGLPIGHVVMGMPYRDVTPGLIALMDKITSQSQAVGGVADIPAGEGMQNVPVGTMLAQIEQATKIMAAAHKGMHQAQALELELIIDLFRANPEDFWRSNKVCPRDYWDEQKFQMALDNCNLVPCSDPNVPSHIHRVAKALGLVQLSSMPQFAPRLNMDEVLKRALRAMREDDKGLVIQPPPATGPAEPDKIVTAQAKMKEAETKAAKVGVDAKVAETNAAVKLAESQGRQEVAKLNLQKEIIDSAAEGRRTEATQGLAARAQVHSETVAERELRLKQEEHLHTRAKDAAELALKNKIADKPTPPAKPRKPKS